MKLKCTALLALCVATFQSHAMDPELSGRVPYTPLATGATQSIIVENDTQIDYYPWEVYAAGDTLYFMLPGREDEEALGHITNDIFNIKTTDKIFSYTEKIRLTNYYAPKVGDKHTFIDNTHTLHETHSNNITKFEPWFLLSASPNGEKIISTTNEPLLSEINTLFISNKLNQTLQEIQEVTDIRQSSRDGSAARVWESRNLSNSMIAFTNKENQREILVTNTGKTILLPNDAQIDWPRDVQLNDDLFYTITNDNTRIAHYSFQAQTWVYSRPFEYIWDVSSNKRYVLAYEMSKPFYVFDLYTNTEIRVAGMDQVNAIARTQNITPAILDGDYTWTDGFFGTTKAVFTINSTDPRTREKRSPFGLILDMTREKILGFDQGKFLTLFPETPNRNEYMIVKHLHSQENDINHYNLAKMDTSDSTPIDWIAENVQVSSMRQNGYPSNSKRHLLLTHADGIQKILQLPEGFFIDAGIQDYITDETYDVAYFHSTNRIVIVKSAHNPAPVMTELQMSLQEMYNLIEKTQGSLTGNPRKEWNNQDLAKKIRDIKAQSCVLHEMKKYGENEEGAPYEILIIDTNTSEIVGEIICDSYRFASFADQTFAYLITYSHGDEAVKVWHVGENSDLDQGMTPGNVGWCSTF